MFYKVLFVVVALELVFTPAEADSWQKEFTKEGITIYTKSVPGSAMKAFMAEAIIDAPMETVNRILIDTPGQVKWIPDCIFSIDLQKISETHLISYNETKAPVVDNRDVVVETRITISKDKIIHSFRALNRPDLKPELKGKVRIKDMEGKWELTRMGDKTMVIYEVRANPGGSMPAWLVNSASKDVPLKTIRGLRQMAASGKY